MFADYETVKKLTHAFPFMIKIIQQILNFETERFLPRDVNYVLTALIDLRKDYDKKARSKSAPHVKPRKSFRQAKAAVYPHFPVHSLDYRYAADSNNDETNDIFSNKEFSESPSITVGITHITFQHSMPKGFTALQKGGVSFDDC